MREVPLDGLRGVAALNVAMAHFVLAFCPMLLKGQYPDLQIAPAEHDFLSEILSSFPVVVLFNGHFAVMVFFVLSGYVLSLPNYEGRKDVLVCRLILRFPRLAMPLLVAVMISYLLWTHGGYVNVGATLVGASKWFSRYYNERPYIIDAMRELVFVGDNIFIPPGWTIRFEFLGSVILLSYYLLCPYRLQRILFVPLAFVLWMYAKQDSIFLMSILLGSLFSVFDYGKSASLGLLFFLGVFFGCYSDLSNIYELLPKINPFDVEVFRAKDFYNLLGAFLIVFSVRNGFGEQFFSSHPLQGLGVMSYSIYLMHFPVLCSLVARAYLSGSFLSKNILLLAALYSVLVLITGWIFFLLIDRPVLVCLSKISLQIKMWARKLATR